MSGVALAQGPGQPSPPGAAGRGQRPARATPQRAEAPRGTAVLKGQIITADNGQPIRRAQVRISSPEVREGRVATTDAQGRFEIRELPAGRYSMTASKGGFVSLQFGQRRPSESGTPIELGDGQTIDKITIALPRGSVLGGRITDEFGEPVANAVVMAWRYGYAAGTRRLMPTQAANSRDTTDDQGHYRLFGLPPGEYVVSAMLRGGGPEVTDPMGGELSGYAATYFPGTSSIGEASRVTLAVSQENTGINFGLIATRLSRVSGQVIMSDGAPATAGTVALVPTNASGGRAVVMQQGGAGNRIDGSGTFRMTNVAPGRYQLQARAGGREFEMARMELTVGNDDVDGLTLVTAPAAAISGSIVSDTGEPFDFRPQQVQVTVRPASPEGQGMPGGGGGGLRVADDWTFTVRSVSDAVLVRATAPQGWMLKSVIAGGEDITDRPVEFAPGQTTSGVQITLTKKVSMLTGLVTDTRGNPVLDAAVVVFPADEELWTFQSRFIKAARPDQEGKYRLTALPSADYLIAAVQGLEDGQAGDPEFLASIRDGAASFELAEGETKAVDVKLRAVRQ
jgi:hypothetical protein